MLMLEQNSRGVILTVRAHAGARQNGILGVRERAIRVAVTAAPEKGKANHAIIALLSKTFGISQSQIELISGETSSKKRMLVTGIEIAQLRKMLAAIIAACDQ